MVMRVRIRRLGGLAWVVALALALEWKGGRGWGYGRACQNTECGWLLRRWHGKGGEGGDMVVHVGIRSLGSLVWVVDEVLVLEWREWVCGRACRNTQVRRAGVGGG